mmetsp:Transcript_123489/g.193759  ORF Transcript_123489/g.193759 Transcript_123489/m.193759 type:complete len:114 (-) Transcript_123489:36-377(-)|eukprot:CAMPEP_0169122936 /NCGR_PEP_ID=MMETSP1015-20121227/33509_1 /TAXON_ID=342587 /ORGANISM="Karlodinium micrum, Strain CCMP2283" /LENGTH=113 /DNA_ID=CAMNT_0009186223 /DNA_START=48 /DNA_END=389 /DNA_ORIENTATION=+
MIARLISCFLALLLANASIVHNSHQLKQQTALRTAAVSQQTPALAGKMPLKAAEQGFEGEKVKHVDQKTFSADWGDEYGNPTSAPLFPHKSASSSLVASVFSTMVVAVSLSNF